MTLSANTTTTVKDPTIGYGLLQFSIAVTRNMDSKTPTYGAIRMNRCRQCLDGTWEADPAGVVKSANQSQAEVLTIVDTIIAAVDALNQRLSIAPAGSNFNLTITEMINAGAFTAPTRLIFTGGARPVSWVSKDLLTDPDAAEVQTAKPVIDAQLAALNARLNLL